MSVSTTSRLGSLLLMSALCAGCFADTSQVKASLNSEAQLARTTQDNNITSLGNAYQALRQIGTGDPRNGTPETDVPEAAKTLLMQVKHGLRELIGDTINRTDNRNATPLQLRAQVVQRLAQAKIKVIYPNDEEPPEAVDPDINAPEIIFLYGEVRRIKIQTPAHHPNLLAVTTTVSVPYGEDTSLYLFRRANGYWQLVLAHEASDYKDITGAQAQFIYAVSPPDENGNFFIVAAHIPPWFVSCWSSLRYSVLRIGQEPYTPQVLLQSKSSVFRCEEPPYEVHVQPKGFHLVFVDHQLMDKLNGSEGVEREDIKNQSAVKYKVEGGKVTLISPPRKY